MQRYLDVAVEKWPIAGRFAIARGSRTEAEVVVVEIHDGERMGRGESVPYRRYGETVTGTVAAIRALAGDVAAGLDRNALRDRMPPGAGRNAIDCALFDLEAKLGGRSAAEIAGLHPLRPVETAYTLSLDTPEAMAAAAEAAASRPLLKLKLGGGPDDVARIGAVRRAAPKARLIVDANEAWAPAELEP
ncbi:MAG TPA: dipeptide epimerase, partial [Bauldia sp.]|nr:dipeptide epimerase [Bauldia sp.]